MFAPSSASSRRAPRARTGRQWTVRDLGRHHFSAQSHTCRPRARRSSDADGERTGDEGERDPKDGTKRSSERESSSGEESERKTKLVPFAVRVATPPPRELGVHKLPKNTTCGETIEVRDGWFIVNRVTTMYSLERGKYRRDGQRVEVESAERYFVNASLESAYRAASATREEDERGE
ncbi:unnamed product [Ostreococcus tauri]|uniref:Unnamed product n=1 Tax=Ostreococcus tauri TaxID=70448 RepID=A0A090M5S6_OSTTA|nr:unnamed product [Ostreococcus tauri]CEF99541.1 unnamed product [Ostreococcus tauri]|eukprot:XP_022839893.1 unnamed product [Ostreococcus tauri]